FGLVSPFAGNDRPAAVFHVLHHGAAGLLGAGSRDLYFHLVCLRIRRGLPLVSAGHPAAGFGARLEFHALSLLALFSREHLPGPDEWQHAVAGNSDSTWLDAGRLWPGAVRVEPRPQEILRRRRLIRLA